MKFFEKAYFLKVFQIIRCKTTFASKVDMITLTLAFFLPYSPLSLLPPGGALPYQGACALL